MGLEYRFIFVSDIDEGQLRNEILEAVNGKLTDRPDTFLLPGLKARLYRLTKEQTELEMQEYAHVPATKRILFRLTDYSVPDLEVGIVRVIDYILGREKGDAALMSLGDGPPDLIRKNGDLVLYDNIDSEKDFFDRPDMRALLTHPYRVVKRKGRFAKA